MMKMIRKEFGNSLAETALLLPVFLLLGIGVADIGNGFTTFIALSNAAREGARWITINPGNNAGALNRVYAEAAQVGLTPADITVDFATQNDANGLTVTATINYNYPLLFGAMENLGAIALYGNPPLSVPFTASSTWRQMFDQAPNP